MFSDADRYDWGDVYIPLCLYFNKWRISSVRLGSSVYIPLCLYFNDNGMVDVTICLKFTFHYVSILIRIWYWCFSAFGVYIPLCLYFNQRRNFFYKRRSAVYIPLCLYFNKYLTVSSLGVQFSLHSIMSLF